MFSNNQQKHSMVSDHYSNKSIDRILKNLLRKLRLKIFRSRMYPELQKAGGLSKALNLEFEKINSTFKVAIDANLHLPFTYARVETGNKFCQIYIASKEKLYMSDFWRNGVCVAHASIDNISDLAKVIDFWLKENVSTQALAEEFSFVKPDNQAKAFDDNNEVEYTWNCILQNGNSLELEEFVQLASRDEILSKLFPFTSLYTLCFSRCTGFPYDTTDLPNVTPKQYIHFALSKSSPEYAKVKQDQDNIPVSKIYVVTKNINQYLGEGDVNEALKIVQNNLPDNIGPAVKGTKNNYQK
jgi:hypothetical protein